MLCEDVSAWKLDMLRPWQGCLPVLFHQAWGICTEPEIGKRKRMEKDKPRSVTYVTTLHGFLSDQARLLRITV